MAPPNSNRPTTRSPAASQFELACLDADLARALGFRYAWRRARSWRVTRIAIVISFLSCLSPAQASMIGCEAKTADPLYCQNGARRAICTQGGYVVWADSRVAVSAGELAFLMSDGPVPRPACAKVPAPAAPAK